MAHRSYLSPDGKWVLLVEVDRDHFWLPCRLVPRDGSAPGRQVGPLGGGCTSAAWSHDGRWMYFSANPGSVNHIWRQRFPDGQPEQITSGPTEEEGIAMAPDGRSFVTAVALQNTSIWIHDANGERQISLEGNGTNPKFTPDGKRLCYLIVGQFPNQFAWRNPGELRIADLESGRSEPVLSSFPVLDYDISGDGRQVVMWATDSEGKSRLWLAPFDHSSPPVQIPNVEGGQPRFGPGGDIFFRQMEFVYRVHPGGTGFRKALAEPVFLLGRWTGALCFLRDLISCHWQQANPSRESPKADFSLRKKWPACLERDGSMRGAWCRVRLPTSMRSIAARSSGTCIGSQSRKSRVMPLRSNEFTFSYSRMREN